MPGDGDSASISPVGHQCRSAVDEIPNGLALDDQALTGSQACLLRVSGGSLTLLHTFTWETGMVDTSMDLAAGATAVVSGDAQGQLHQRLVQPLTVHGSLDLHAADLRMASGVALTVAPQGSLSVSVASTLSTTRCCIDPARLVNQGTLSVGPSALLVTRRVAVEQRGVMRVPETSFVMSVDAPIAAAAGSRYAGSGRWVWSNASQVVLNGSLLLSGGFHLELGNDGTVGSRLSGFGQLAGHGVLDWTGGTIAAGLLLATGIRWHAYGERTGAGQRYLSGLATTADGSTHAQTQVSTDGPMVIDHDAVVTMRHHAIVTLSSTASLTLAPGSSVVGRTKSGQPDAIFTSGTPIVVPADEAQPDPALLDNVELYTEGGPVRIAPDSQLRLVGSVRSLLAFNVFKGGGVLSVGAPIDTITELDFTEDTTLALTAGGSLDGGTLYRGDGRLDWTGGQVSGGVSFDLTAVVVRGPDVKSVVVTEGGGESFAQMLSPVTFASGRPAEHNPARPERQQSHHLRGRLDRPRRRAGRWELRQLHEPAHRRSRRGPRLLHRSDPALLLVGHAGHRQR